MRESAFTPAQRAAILAALVPANITQVYSGRPGCGCGCKGTYWSRGPMLAKTLNALKAVPADDIAIGDPFGGLVVFSYETAQRYRWLYVTEAVFADVVAKAVTSAA